MQNTRKWSLFIHAVTVFSGHEWYDSMQKPPVEDNHSMLEELSKCFSRVNNIGIC